ncbi:MAG: hypothetical protein HY646_20705 [Acidobacteria bacterium]|nr:hypothetical protein [Acidobacteriota bacterium]
MKPLIVLLVTAAVVAAQQRFDMLVREDFFAGFAGNMERLEKAMKVTEDALAKDPKHAEAKVWHGAGVFFRASQAFAKGDFQRGMQFWEQGLAEMEQAVRMAPSNIGVLIPRGASLIASSRFTPPEFGKPILETGVGDYEKVLKIQEPTMAKMSTHSKGELLIGLADGWSRLGNTEKARQYFERIVTELKGSPYETKARAWLENKPDVKNPEFFNCTGCHVR